MKYNDYENYFERNKSYMEEFLKQKKKKNSLGFIIMALIGILLFIGGISSYNKEVVEKKWGDVSETNEYGYIDGSWMCFSKTKLNN